MNGPFISRRWPKSVVQTQEIEQQEIIDPLELPQQPIPAERNVEEPILPPLPPPRIPDIPLEIPQNQPRNRNALTALYRRFFPSSNNLTLNEIEMQRLFQPPPPPQQIFHPHLHQAQPQPQPQVQDQPQPQAQESETLYGPQAFLDDDIYIEECYLTHNGSRLSSIQSVPCTRDLDTRQYFQFKETVGSYRTPFATCVTSRDWHGI